MYSGCGGDSTSDKASSAKLSPTASVGEKIFDDSTYLLGQYRVRYLPRSGPWSRRK